MVPLDNYLYLIPDIMTTPLPASHVALGLADGLLSTRRSKTDDTSTSKVKDKGNGSRRERSSSPAKGKQHVPALQPPAPVVSKYDTILELAQSCKVLEKDNTDLRNEVARLKERISTIEYRRTVQCRNEKDGKVCARLSCDFWHHFLSAKAEKPSDEVASANAKPTQAESDALCCESSNP
jgi:hypothetical protein